MHSATQIKNGVKPEQEIAVISANPLDLPAETFQAGLDRRKQNRSSLMAWIREALIEGSDFGKIHVVGRNKCQTGKHCKNPNHFSKPSLFKPGAEKICGMLGVTVRYPTLADYEQTALSGIQLTQIIIRCEIVDASNRIIADGVGARILSQDNGDINKSLKMAEKSAHIDATLRMAGLSEIFTQDIEDMTQQREAVSVQQATSKLKTEFQGISKAQHKRLESRIRELGLDRDRVKNWMIKASHNRFNNFMELSQHFYQKLDKKLEDFAERTTLEPEVME